VKADLKFLKNLRLNYPVNVVSGDTIAVTYRDISGVNHELIKENITGSHHFEEVAVFEGTLEDGRYCLGGLLIEDKRPTDVWLTEPLHR
jgi:hypothetical protein